MDNHNRPRGREKNVTGSSNGVHRRGEGLGTGPVGMGDGYQSRKSGGMGKRAAAGGGGSLIVILLILGISSLVALICSLFSSQNNTVSTIILSIGTGIGLIGALVMSILYLRKKKKNG